MGGTYEDARLGSNADREVCGKRGHLSDKSPRLAATAVANALTVATNVIFIDLGEQNRSWDNLTKSPLTKGVGSRGCGWVVS